MLADDLHTAESDPWKPWQRGDGEFFQAALADCRYHVLKPLRFMNVSGGVVRSFAGYYKIKPSEIVVCYDDFALPFGRTRMRLKGSSGGHNGMDSIIEQFGTDEIPRIRIGIGPVPPRQDPKDFVLGRLSKEELGRLDGEIFPKMDKVLMAILEKGYEAGMNLCNAPEEGDPA
jgi:PTH1 family peptidyl-tRNA hydrolase